MPSRSKEGGRYNETFPDSQRFARRSRGSRRGGAFEKQERFPRVADVNRVSFKKKKEKTKRV